MMGFERRAQSGPSSAEGPLRPFADNAARRSFINWRGGGAPVEWNHRAPARRLTAPGFHRSDAPTTVLQSAMPILDLYSRRRRQAEKAGPDVYQYDEIPRELRVQIVQIWRDAIGPCLPPDPYGMRSEYDEPPPNNEDCWREIHEAPAREKGMFELAKGDDASTQCANYLLGASDADDILDVIEVTFRIISSIAQSKAKMQRYEWEGEANRRGIKQDPEAAILELNFRLRGAGLGYQFEQEQIIRVDSQYVHAEAVKPALELLSDPRFQGPHQEFLHAHDLYRAAKPGDGKALEDAVAAALKSFESTLKVMRSERVAAPGECDRRAAHPCNRQRPDTPLSQIIVGRPGDSEQPE